MVGITAVCLGGNHFSALGPGNCNQVPAFLELVRRTYHLHFAYPVHGFALVQDGGCSHTFNTHFFCLCLHIFQGLGNESFQLFVSHILLIYYLVRLPGSGKRHRQTSTDY